MASAMASVGSGSDQSGNECNSGETEKGKDIKQPSDTKESSETQPLGRGQFCLLSSTSSSQPFEVGEKGQFWKDKDLGQPLGRGDFCLPCTSLAPALLGRTLCRRLPSGAILQAEVNKCLNITSKETGACVLLRAAKPLKGIEAMFELRGRPGVKEWELCKGPGNLCRAMGIGKDEDDLDMASEDPHLWLEEGREVSHEEMVACKRVNVTSATPFRWYIRNCKSVSKRDRVAEDGSVLNSKGEKDEEKNSQPYEDSLTWRGQEYSWPPQLKMELVTFQPGGCI